MYDIIVRWITIKTISHCKESRRRAAHLSHRRLCYKDPCRPLVILRRACLQPLPLPLPPPMQFCKFHRALSDYTVLVPACIKDLYCRHYFPPLCCQTSMPADPMHILPYCSGTVTICSSVCAVSTDNISGGWVLLFPSLGAL